MVSLICGIIQFLCVLYLVSLNKQDKKRHFEENFRWYEERQKLLDRIQSGSVIEYKQAQNLDKPKEKKEKKDVPNFL